MAARRFPPVFKRARKLSLCYYCAARFDRISGVLMVDSGVEAANKDKAKDEILRQLEVIQNGEFEENELAQTKLALTGSFKALPIRRAVSSRGICPRRFRASCGRPSRRRRASRR
ncbi:MAG: insulinase family protein [Oscillospiraceae bacterium]